MRSATQECRCARESVCCAQDDMEGNVTEEEDASRKSVGAAGPWRQLLRIQQVMLPAKSQPHPVEIEVHDRSGEKGKRLAHDQPADNGNSQRAS